MHTNADVQFSVRNQTRIALILNETVFFQFARQVPASVSEMFADSAWPCALSTPHAFHPSESSGSSLQVTVHAAVRLRGLQR